LIFCFRADLRLVLFFVVKECIKRKYGDAIFEISSKITTIFKSFFRLFSCILTISLVILKPKLPDVLVEIGLLFLEWSTIVIFAVIVTECNKYRSVREVLGKKLLHLPMSLLQQFVMCSLLIWVVRKLIRFDCYSVSDEIPSKKNVVNHLTLVYFYKELHDILN